jgi:peptidoglycan/LPS O-acetylase OafA/YrhL
MDPRIDRLRGYLAIGVMLGHAIDLAHLSTPDATAVSMIYRIALALRPYLGFICVLGFIVLSGYCITRSTLKGFSIGHYTMRRVTRLYPLLIVAVLLTAAFEFATANSPHRPVLWQTAVSVKSALIALAGLSGFRGQFGGLAPTYTLSYELMYYTVWGLALVSTRGRHSLGWGIAVVVTGLLWFFGESIRATVGPLADFFTNRLAIALLGAGLALYERPLTAIGRYLPVPAMWFMLALAYTLANDIYRKPDVTTTNATDALYYTVMAGLLIATMAAWLARPSRPNATDTWLGELSYPLFLIHGPTIIALQFAINALGLKPDFQVTFAVLVIGSIAMAQVLTILVERPLMSWRRRGKPAPQPARAVPADAQRA